MIRFRPQHIGQYKNAGMDYDFLEPDPDYKQNAT